MKHVLAVTFALWTCQSGLAQTDRPNATKAEPSIVHFKTSDGVKIVADYYAPKTGGKKKAPVAILVHMYPAQRGSWKPLVARLIDAGFAVLAYDIRGTGESTEPAAMKLRAKYKGRDKDHFNNAWRDAEAAKTWLAEQPGCDTSRVVMIGASIGCSISLRFGGMDGDVKAIVCLSPGTNYMGVDSIADIRKCTGRTVLLVSPEAEFGNVEKLAGSCQPASGKDAKRLVDLMVEIAKRFEPGKPNRTEASDEHGSGASSKMTMNLASDQYGNTKLTMSSEGIICMQLAGGRDRHGTGMFDAPYGKALVDAIVRTAEFAMHGNPPSTQH